MASLGEQSRTLHDENERLRRELTRFATENEILRALQSPSTPEQSSVQKPTTELAAIYPRDIEDEDASEALLTAAATCDYIQGHDLYRRGLLDIDNVAEIFEELCQNTRRLRCDPRRRRQPSNS